MSSPYPPVPIRSDLLEALRRLGVPSSVWPELVPAVFPVITLPDVATAAISHAYVGFRTSGSTGQQAGLLLTAGSVALDLLWSRQEAGPLGFSLFRTNDPNAPIPGGLIVHSSVSVMRLYGADPQATVDEVRLGSATSGYAVPWGASMELTWGAGEPHPLRLEAGEQLLLLTENSNADWALALRWREATSSDVPG